MTAGVLTLFEFRLLLQEPEFYHFVKSTVKERNPEAWQRQNVKEVYAIFTGFGTKEYTQDTTQNIAPTGDYPDWTFNLY